MASSDQRSLISGSHSIPFNRDSADAFQDMTAFTPPPENWLARYPKVPSAKKEDKTQPKKTTVVPEANQLDDPCKKYIETSEIPVKSNKSLGTDDHFKSAVCSKNLLKACEKLMTNKDFFSADEDDFDAELSLMNEKSRMEFYRSKYGNRRDSQSLPASPKMERKSQTPIAHNPYFTISKPETRANTSISFLTNLFGITAKNPNEAPTNIAQKYESTSNPTFSGDNGKQNQQSSRQLTPQPHPYREMNIFSPTSM